MKPRPDQIRCSTTKEGNIEAWVSRSEWLVINRQTGALVYSTVKEGTDMFRWLVTEARKHKAI